MSDAAAQPQAKRPRLERTYQTIDTAEGVTDLVARARAVGRISFNIEMLIDPDSPIAVDPLRSALVGMAVALGPGEAYYLPFAHRGSEDEEDGAQHELIAASAPVPAGRGAAAARPGGSTGQSGGGSIAARARAAGGVRPARNLPRLDSPAMRPLRDLLEDASIAKNAQNAKFEILALRRSGVRLAGLDFDTMVASYVLDPGRRSHALDVLAMEFLDHTVTSYEELCGKGKSHIPYDLVPVDCARDYACEDADLALRLRALFEPELAEHELSVLFRDMECRS